MEERRSLCPVADCAVLYNPSFSVCSQFGVYYNVFDAVPLDGRISYADLAQKCNVLKSHLRRWMRHAISKRIFQASTKDSVAHTITSAECVRDETVWAWIGHNERR
jgi:hypothetical protein